MSPNFDLSLTHFDRLLDELEKGIKQPSDDEIFFIALVLSGGLYLGESFESRAKLENRIAQLGNPIWVDKLIHLALHPPLNDLRMIHESYVTPDAIDSLRYATCSMLGRLMKPLNISAERLIPLMEVRELQEDVMSLIGENQIYDALFLLTPFIKTASELDKGERVTLYTVLEAVGGEQACDLMQQLETEIGYKFKRLPESQGGFLVI